MIPFKKTAKQLLTPLLIGSIGIDATFFIAWGLVLTPFFNKIIQTAIEIAKNVKTLQAVLEHTLFAELIRNILIAYIIAFALYIIFHGTAWWIARKITQRPMSYAKAILGFLKVNLLWGALIIIINIIDIYFKVRHELYIAAGAEVPNIPGIMLMILFWTIALLAFTSYPKLSIKSAFTNWKKKYLLIIACIILFQAAIIIPKPLYTISPTLGNIIGFILIFPTFAYIRALAINTL